MVNKNFLLTTMFIILINMILEAYYLLFLSENFNYIGFKLDFSIVKYTESKILFLIFIIMSGRLFKNSQFLYSVFILLLLFFFIPNSIMFGFMNHIRGPLYSISLLLFLFLNVATIKLPVRPIYLPRKTKYFLAGGIALILLIPILLNFGFKFNINTLFLRDIYETRDIFSARISKLENYFYNWEAKTIIPVVLVFFLISKKYFFSIASFFILIYLYVISGNKAVYMTTLVTLFFYFLGNKYVYKIQYFLFFLICFFLIIPIVDVFVFDTVLFRGVLVMRPVFFPALLNYCYFDFFESTKLFFSENAIFNLFFQSPLDTKSAYKISEVYFNTSEMYANNGIISDGFMNLGYLGVFFLSALFGLIFMFFNSLSIDERYFGIFFIYVFFFLSAPMFTVIASGGLWILFFFSMFLMKKSIVGQNL